jgi:hypothetical protein
MNVADPVHRFESGFVQRVIAALFSDGATWRLTAYIREFDYGTGRTDLVATTERGRVLAFEAKLTRWRGALRQAYRNRAFAHASYVVLPQQAAAKAVAHRDEFERYGIGLCTVEMGRTRVLIAARDSQPLLFWLSARALAQLGAENGSARPQPRGRGRMREPRS